MPAEVPTPPDAEIGEGGGPERCIAGLFFAAVLAALPAAARASGGSVVDTHPGQLEAPAP